jgi:hypothetical protein
MEGGGTRVFTKQGKLKKIKEPKVKKTKVKKTKEKKPKRKEGLGPRKIIQHPPLTDLNVPQNEVFELPKKRGRPPKAEPTKTQRKPGDPFQPNQFEYLKDRTSRLGQSLGDKFRDAIADFKSLSKAEKREKLEKLATYKTSYITPE